MKSLTLILSIAAISFTFYISCNNESNITPTNLIENSQKDLIGFECANPHNCEMVHFCLNLIDGSDGSEFNYVNIKRVKVDNIGTDCSASFYRCSYITSGSNPTGMGCFLPWNNSNCAYTRSVCLQTQDNKTYTGSVYFEYNNYNGAIITVYYNPYVNCPFNDIEGNEQ
jgi:hypothetical protein